jgi:ferredoxin
MPTITFVNWNKTVRVGALSNLRRVAQGAGIPLYNGMSEHMNCHGAGLCGTCRVLVEPAAALTPPTPLERLHGCTGPYRLACQVQIASDKHDVHVMKMQGHFGKSKRPQAGPGIPETGWKPA